MPLGALSLLGGRERDERSDRLPGHTLAAVAGAVNAGGFLAVGAYTSHMTGIVSGVADHLALGAFALAAAGFAAWCAFVAGAGVSAVLVNWGRRRGMHSRYAMAALVACFFLGGALGAAGFSRAGHAFCAGPAALLVLLALGPVLRDLRGAA